jgi:hypothetical protein
MHPHPASSVTSPWARRLLIVIFLLLLLTTGVAAAANLFPDPVFPAGEQPQAVVAADFNGDGKVDLAAANWFSADVSILLSLGNGEFEPEQRVTFIGQPTWIAAGDFDVDGKIDLVVNDSANSISILHGVGDGSFLYNPFVDLYPVGDGPQFVAVADLNLDGFPDLAVPNLFSDSIAVFLGKGDGTFQPATYFNAGTGPNSLAVVDFNEDGFPDLVATTQAYEGVILFGHGDGLFDAPLPLGGGTRGYFVISDDFNGDGHPDLAVSDYFLTQASVLIGDGHGGVLSRVVVGGFPLTASWLGSADFDGDGAPDLATSFGVAFGHGDGEFDPLVPYKELPAGNTIADFDADGFPDLAAGNDQFNGGVIVLLNDRRGRLGARLYPTDNRAGILAKGDFTGDGQIDLAAANFFADFIVILPGRADGTFAPEIDVPAATGIRPFVAGDFDGDGRPDLAYSVVPGSTVSVLRGLGNGSFQPPVQTDVGTAPTGLVTGDFNADGRTDLVIFRNDAAVVWVLLGKPDGTFEGTRPIGWVAPPGTPVTIAAVAVGDLDDDGVQDMVVALPALENVTVLLGHGDGTFAVGGNYGAGDHIASLAVGDLNGDGKADVAVGHAEFQIGPPGCCPALGTISVLLGLGGGVLGEEHRYPAGIPNQYISIHIADFNHDGHPDLLGSSSAILFGAGDGTFGQPRAFAHFGTGVVEDFNHDGWPDIAVSLLDIIVDLNRGAGPGRLAAHADADANAECGAESLLDGSASAGDINTFEWFEDYGQAGQKLLGTGVTLSVTLPLGTHHITLRVTDLAGASATDDITITVVDTTAPTITVNITPNPLWPPNNKMVDVSAHLRATDACGSVDVKLASIQGEGVAPSGNGKFASNVGGAEIGTADFSFQLRAVRAPSKQGAYYMVTYTATDSAGNQSSAKGIVRVPHDHRDIPRHGAGQVPIP